MKIEKLADILYDIITDEDNISKLGSEQIEIYLTKENDIYIELEDFNFNKQMFVLKLEEIKKK